MPRLVGVLILALLANVASGRDLYVDNRAGDDARDGSAPAISGKTGGPCRTISRALQMARKGDRIILAKNDEPYREGITLQAGRHSGLEGAPFQLIGNGAMLDGTRPVPRDDWEFVQTDVFRFAPPRKAHQMLYLDGKPLVRKPPGPDFTLPQLEPLEWCLYQGYIYFRVEPDRLPREYALHFTALPVGITIYEVRNLIVSDLVVQGFQLDGINAHDGVFNASLVGLTCRGNGRSGISVGGASQVRIQACLVGDNGTAQIRTEGFSHTQIVNCDLISNTAPALVREGGQVTQD